MKVNAPLKRRVYALATNDERNAAIHVGAGLLALAAMTLPFGGLHLGINGTIAPMIYSGSFVAMLVSAAILRNDFRVSSFLPLAFLSNAFGVTAFLLVPYIFAMPHVLSPNGFGLGMQAGIWLWVTWHAAFALLICAFVAAEIYFSRHPLASTEAKDFAWGYSAGVIIFAATVMGIVLFAHAKLPALVSGTTYTPLFHYGIEKPLLFLSATVFAVMAATTRLRTTTNLWLSVVIIAFSIDTYLTGKAQGSFTIAWYAILVAGGVWQSLFMVVQLRHADEDFVAFEADKKSLTEVALRDALTGLLNRRGFDERLRDLMRESQHAKKSLSLLLLDIDYFKLFNDQFGHPAGDGAIKAIAKVIASVANRNTDACCRVGGEEFALVLGETDASGGRTVAERIRAAVMRLRIPHATEASDWLTVSIGVASLDDETIDGAELYARADKSLYRAKRLGRNRIAAFDDQRDVLQAV